VHFTEHVHTVIIYCVPKCEEERQQQLRERARRLIAEARMGVVGTQTLHSDQGRGPSKLNS
jgi:16S rRNA G1207 methylase RsmC